MLCTLLFGSSGLKLPTVTYRRAGGAGEEARGPGISSPWAGLPLGPFTPADSLLDSDHGRDQAQACPDPETLGMRGSMTIGPRASPRIESPLAEPIGFSRYWSWHTTFPILPGPPGPGFLLG